MENSILLEEIFKNTEIKKM